MIRKWAAVPVASAIRSCHGPPAIPLEPEEAAANQSDGKTMVANAVPLSAAAQSAGAEPDLIVRVGAVPIVVSMESRDALRDAVENWKATISPFGGKVC